MNKDEDRLVFANLNLLQSLMGEFVLRAGRSIPEFGAELTFMWTHGKVLHGRFAKLERRQMVSASEVTDELVLVIIVDGLNHVVEPKDIIWDDKTQQVAT